MSAGWLAVILLALTTMILRASGPLIVGKRPLPAWTAPVFSVLPAALLTALIVVQVFTRGNDVLVDERVFGLLFAGMLLFWRRGAVIAAMFGAAVVVALIRALT